MHLTPRLFSVYTLPCQPDSFNRWEAGQVLAKKLMVLLYHAAADASRGAGTPERIASAGGLNPSLVEAFRALLADSRADGAFKAFAVGLPADSELLDAIPGGNPIVLHQVGGGGRGLIVVAAVWGRRRGWKGGGGLAAPTGGTDLQAGETAGATWRGCLELATFGCQESFVSP